jgi:phage-related protein
MTDIAMPLPKLIANYQYSEAVTMLNVKFGDGYQQRQLNGRNAVKQVWQIEYIWLKATEFTTLDTQLKLVGYTDKITWTPPNESTPRLFNIEPGSLRRSYNAGFVKVSFSMIEF